MGRKLRRRVLHQKVDTHRGFLHQKVHEIKKVTSWIPPPKGTRNQKSYIVDSSTKRYTKSKKLHRGFLHQKVHEIKKSYIVDSSTKRYTKSSSSRQLQYRKKMHTEGTIMKKDRIKNHFIANQRGQRTGWNRCDRRWRLKTISIQAEEENEEEKDE